MDELDAKVLVRTRLMLHGVAELLLAGPQFQASGTIRLRATPGGIGTTTEPDMRVEGDELVAESARVRLSDKTYAEVAAAAGIQPRRLDDLYADGPGLQPQQRVDVDPRAAAVIADAFAVGNTALRALADEQPVLWPEHFDIGIRVDKVNYGVSPGDAFESTPYAYLGPPHPQHGEFWNAPFGAARPLSALGSADGVLAFFQEGRSLMT
jgi:hypothetical protein